mmetsp:Transcript_12973/g.41455  ORF Transcript_12973/g.41455 Transcript_12973/m.41455 type:complete len:200 (-) Transcript_12973:522-1121(-)
MAVNGEPPWASVGRDRGWRLRVAGVAATLRRCVPVAHAKLRSDVSRGSWRSRALLATPCLLAVPCPVGCVLTRPVVLIRPLDLRSAPEHFLRLFNNSQSLLAGVPQRSGRRLDQRLVCQSVRMHMHVHTYRLIQSFSLLGKLEQVISAMVWLMMSTGIRYPANCDGEELALLERRCPSLVPATAVSSGEGTVFERSPVP